MRLAALALLLASTPASAGEVSIRWEAPSSFLAGSQYVVDVALEAPADGADFPAWLLTPAAFAVNETPIAERVDTGTVHLPGGAKLTLSFDLGLYLEPERSFRLAFAPEVLQEDPVDVSLFHAAHESIDFMDLEETSDPELEEFLVLLETNRGSIYLELWPHLAPNHVRNFLDLAHTGFYDGVLFHRVMPGFMIQGGDPSGTGNGSGPRRLKAEFTDEPHERGVLSMARPPIDPDSASCQFFICHADSGQLDGKFSVFGRVKSGMDTVDRIASTPRKGERPSDPQVIRRAVVIDTRK